MGIGPFPFDIGDAAAYNPDDGFGNFFVTVADNNNIFFEVKTVAESIGHFEHDKVGRQRVKGRLQPEKKCSGCEQYDVDKKSGGTDTDAVIFLDNGSDDITATGTSACPV